jgi:hypothetical protein
VLSLLRKKNKTTAVFCNGVAEMDLNREVVISNVNSGEVEKVSLEELLDRANYPQFLFKYRDWSDEYHQRVISHREVYMASPMDFADPNDCKNHIRYDLLSTEELMVALRDFVVRSHPRWNQKTCELEVKRLFDKNRLSDGVFINEMAEKSHAQWSDQSGVLSLARSPEIDKMWTDYANDDQGFCVSFHSREFLPHVGGGGIVEYPDVLPNIYPKPFHNQEKQVWFQIYHKEAKWEYENEYRAITFSPQPLRPFERTRTIAPPAYHAIILGKYCTVKNQSLIREAVRSSLGDIKEEFEDKFGRRWLVINPIQRSK